MNNDVTKYVADWFSRSDDDLVLVKLILEKGTGSPNLACFHAQQAAEKYLKGFWPITICTSEKFTIWRFCSKIVRKSMPLWQSCRMTQDS